ncbi:MAG: bis(5'-nucleosyl)-tetraphosphatase [Nanoarchaeota archaeon]
MKQENSAGALIFYFDKEQFEPNFLLLKYTNYWGFPKGWIEKNETEKEAAIRETKEETNLDVELIPDFKEIQRWIFRAKDELIKKECTYFLAEISEDDSKKVKISNEHEEFIFITLEKSKEYIKIKSNKEMLKKAFDFIKEKKKQKTLF